jgi:2-oxoisovalerate dehydrogenase E2 component (dihydrolipoyl transacylase)
MAEEWASPQAEEKAQELGVALEDVEGTGKEGRATVEDVQRTADNAGSASGNSEAAVQPPEKLIYADINPKLNLGEWDKLEVFDSEGNSRVLTSDPSSRIMSESEFDDFNTKHPPTHEHPNGFAMLLKGREVS